MSTSDPSPSARDPSSDAFHQLLAEYLARAEKEGSGALEEFRQKHPAFASRLGRQIEWLANHLTRGREGLPERIGPYRVIQLLGSGGMGAVYLAEQMTPFRRPVAVKVIRIGRDSEPRLQRFAAEIQTLALLNHDGIAKVFEAGNDHGRPYFAMEYVPGKSITAYCAEERLGLDARLRLFVDVCRAVEYAHRQGIIHRDLKPQNILVHGPASDPVAKVIDFGLAKAVQPDPMHAAQTQTAQIVGTPDYMSPEQVDDSGQSVVDTRADVYSLGVVLYELLTGVLPLSLWQSGGQDMQALIRAIREREPSSPSVRVEASPSTDATSPSACGDLTPRRLSRLLAGDLDSIVMKALAKDANRRYSGVAQLADDIQRYLRHEPVSSRPASAGYVLRKFARRHRFGVGFVAVLAVTGIGSLLTINAYALEAVRQLERNNLFGLAGYLQELRLRDQFPPPARAEHVHQLRTWLREFDTVFGQRERMRALVEAPEEDADAASVVDWATGANAQATLRQALRRTIELLDLMVLPGHERDTMLLRIDWAQRVRAETVDAHQAEWERVRREVLDDWGFDLSPQVGLVPLGRDRDTKLQEFAFPLPGMAVPRREGGRLVIEARTCPVLVLLPGGDVLVGSQGTDPRAPNHDPEWRIWDDEVQSVHLLPFFASKYEFTNGQWQLLDEGDHGSEPLGVLFEPTHPAVDLEGLWIVHVIKAWGMRLPTWQEWDYLARAGAPTARWCGPDFRSLQHNENVFDRSVGATQRMDGEGDAAPWSDDHPATAPVGHFPHNAFLLHDVLGNVREVAVRQEGADPLLEVRAGSWHQGAIYARTAEFTTWDGAPRHAIGFRPVLSVKP